MLDLTVSVLESHWRVWSRDVTGPNFSPVRDNGCLGRIIGVEVTRSGQRRERERKREELPSQG